MNIDIYFVDADGNSIDIPFDSEWLTNNMVEIVKASTNIEELHPIYPPNHNYMSQWPWQEGDYCSSVLKIPKLYTEHITQYNIGSRLQPIYYDFVKWANEFIESGGSIFIIEDN
jgi:hypothetical protein